MNDSLLKKLNTILCELSIPAETGVFTDTPPDVYCVLTPLTDMLSEFADNKPSSEVQEVILSIKLDTLTARILKLSSDCHSQIVPAPLYSRRKPTDC